MIDKRLQALRKHKGLSQESLADLSGLSIRTIQRLEAGVSKPRAYTMKTLAEALDVDLLELIAQEKGKSDETRDYRFVRWMNLSILGQLVLPLANIVLPLIIWRKWREQHSVKEFGAGLISFQIWWTLGSLLLLISAPMLSLALTGQAQVGQFPMVGAIYFFLIFLNVGLSLYIASDPERRAAPFYRRIPVLF